MSLKALWIKCWKKKLIVIKSKRPFSSAVFANNSNKGNNKIISVNKEEIKNIFGDENSNIKSNNNNNNNDINNNKNVEKKIDSNIKEKENSNKDISINNNIKHK